MPFFLLRIQKWLLLCSVNLEYKPRWCSAMPNNFASIDGHGFYQHVYGYKDGYMCVWMYVCILCLYVCKYSELFPRVYVCSMCEKNTVNVYSIWEWKARICFFELAQYMYVCMYECVPCLLNVCACRACLLMSCTQVGVGVVAVEAWAYSTSLLLSTCAQERLHGHVCMQFIYACMYVCVDITDEYYWVMSADITQWYSLVISTKVKHTPSW